MRKILILGDCKELDLYFLSDDSVKAVFGKNAADTGILSEFEAVIAGGEQFPGQTLDPVKNECARLGIPFFCVSRSDCRMTTEGVRIREFLLSRGILFHPAENLLIGNSFKIRELRKKVGSLSGKDCGVFILGETGTGKEVLAELICRQSKRASRPFIKINCAAIPPGLAESQMFGSEVGAYIDAVSFAGFLEKACGGTLFLDEIPDLPFELQGKFLRVLEEKSFFRVGGKKRIVSDFRLLAASNRPRSELFRGMEFRSDLYYRIAECVLEIPPLRERIEDIPLLCRRFLGADRVGDSAMDKLTAYRWPGNVRELKNVLTRAEINASGRILCADDITF